MVSNFVSGLVLLVERPVRLGDRVEVGDTYGDVMRIGGRSTWIRTNDNEIIIVPNSEFVTARVTNWTANDRSVRFSDSGGCFLFQRSRESPRAASSRLRASIRMCLTILRRTSFLKALATAR